MITKSLTKKIQDAHSKQRRLIAPLLGFPGLNMLEYNIKVAQQNYGMHFQVIKKIYDVFQPDIIFPLMDLSVEANALGNYTVFPKDDSPTVIKENTPILNDLKLPNVDISFDTRLLGYVETVRLMNIGLPKNVLKGAYVTGPYSLAALIIGAEDAAMATVMQEKELKGLCQFATEQIQKYIHLLITAGADVICILEPSAVMLGPDQFETFSSEYINHLTNTFKYTDASIIYHTCGNTMHLIDKMVDSGVDGLSLDSESVGIDLLKVAKQIPKEIALIGNISPTETILTGSTNEVENEVLSLLKKMEGIPNFILSTGCDLPQDVPLKNIHAFMNAGREYKLKK